MATGFDWQTEEEADENEATDWSRTRIRMMQQGNWPEWATFGLWWVGPAAEPVIALSPDLTQGNVTRRLSEFETSRVCCRIVTSPLD